MAIFEIEVHKTKWNANSLSDVRRRGENLIKPKTRHLFKMLGENDKSERGIAFVFYNGILFVKIISTSVTYVILKLNQDQIGIRIDIISHRRGSGHIL